MKKSPAFWRIESTAMNPEPRNIILCSDGTENRFGRHNTNVDKLYKALDCGKIRKCFYDPGVGTYSPAGKIRNLLGKMFGIHDTPRP